MGAIEAPRAHGYAHPVENPGDERPRRRRPRCGPHESTPPAYVVVKCAGRYPLCGGSPSHPRYGSHDVSLQLHPSVARQIAQLNTAAHERAVADHLEELDSLYDNQNRAGTEEDPKLYRTGHCDPGAPKPHRACKDRYTQRRTVPNRGGGYRTVVELFLCVCDADCCGDHELQQRARAAAAPTAAATAWTADEVADLMVELEVCPLCSNAWDAHNFTDDDRVVCV